MRPLITGYGTMLLACELRIALAHVAAVRETGPAATRRIGGSVRYTLAPLGMPLLRTGRGPFRCGAPRLNGQPGRP